MSFRKRNGKWHYRYRVMDAKTGKWKQKETRGFATKKEATQESLKIQSELEKGTYIQEEKITFLDFSDKWIEIYASTGRVKDSTVRMRKAAINRVKKYLGEIKLKDISKLMYNNLLINLKNDGYARRSVALVHEALSLLFAKAVELETIKTNPALGAEIPIYQKTVEELESNTELPKYLEKEDLSKYLETVEQHGSLKEYTVFFLLSYTGIRVGELCALKWKDINKDEMYISITKTLSIISSVDRYEISTPKTKSSKREVTVSEKVIQVLTRYESWLKEYKMSKRNVYKDNDFVFVNSRRTPGHPESPIHLNWCMKKYLNLAQLPNNLSPHSLRHTHVSLLAEAGVALETIQKRMGHKNDRVTAEIYLHITKTREKEASELFEKLMDF